MSIKYELVASAGKFTDKTGEEKTRWHKCGIVMTTQKGGLVAKVESLPVGFDGWLNLWEPKPKDGKSKGKQEEPIDDGRIPF